MKNARGWTNRSQGMTVVHPNAASVDIGSRIHVNPCGCDGIEGYCKPVRAFKTFTDDLQRLADRFHEAGSRRWRKATPREGPESFRRLPSRVLQQHIDDLACPGPGSRLAEADLAHVSLLSPLSDQEELARGRRFASVHDMNR